MHGTLARTNLSFDEAMAELRRGTSVRRACWEKALIRGADGYPAWDITDELARACSMSGKNADKSYAPHATDEAATDWQTVAA